MNMESVMLKFVYEQCAALPYYEYYIAPKLQVSYKIEIYLKNLIRFNLRIT